MDVVRALTFELSGPEPGWRLGREADAKPESLAAQVPSRWRSASSEGLGGAATIGKGRSCKH